jgi:F0F1-type ATP synthase assembly protein I
MKKGIIKKIIVLGLLTWMTIGGFVFVIQDFSMGSLALLFGLIMILIHRVLVYFVPKFQDKTIIEKKVVDDL